MRILKLAIVALLTVMLVQAQTPAMRADIPFDFEMRNITLPGGEYRVHIQPSYIIVKAVENKESAIAVTFGFTPKDRSANEVRLVFNKYGDRYFLSQVWHPYTVRELPKSKQERELVTSRVVAQNPVRVVIAARLVR